jgi:hypothetical protein
MREDTEIGCAAEFALVRSGGVSPP